MLLKRIRVAVVVLLLAGCALTFSSTNVADVVSGSYLQTSRQKFNVVVMTPGAAQKQATANRNRSQSAAGTSSEPQQLPNYKEETLTLALL